MAHLLAARSTATPKQAKEPILANAPHGQLTDKIEEMKTICWFCHKKAIMNLHYIDGKPVYEGAQVQIGGNEAYYPVCRHHYFHPEI